MKSLAELVPGTTLREIAAPAKPGWVAFNPSIAQSPHGYACILRASNYRLDPVGRYSMPGEVIETRNSLLTMDDELNVVDSVEIDFTHPGEVLYPWVLGLEDARLIWSEGFGWNVYGTLRQHRADGVCQIGLYHLGNGTAFGSVLKSPSEGRHEKNWTYLPHGRFLYTYEPPQTTDGGGNRSQYAQQWMTDLSDLRGGSPAIPYGDGYLAVGHEVTWINGFRHYWHRFVELDTLGFPTRYTEPFYFKQKGIEFAAGLVAWRDQFVVSFGFKDARALLATIPQSGVEELLDL